MPPFLVETGDLDGWIRHTPSPLVGSPSRMGAFCLLSFGSGFILSGTTGPQDHRTTRPDRLAVREFEMMLVLCSCVQHRGAV